MYVNDTPDVEMTETSRQLLFSVLMTKFGVHFDSLNLLAEHPAEMFIFLSSYSGV